MELAFRGSPRMVLAKRFIWIFPYTLMGKPERVFLPTQYNATGCWSPKTRCREYVKARTQLKSTRATLGDRDTCLSGAERNSTPLLFPGWAAHYRKEVFLSEDGQHHKRGQTASGAGVLRPPESGEMPG